MVFTKKLYPGYINIRKLKITIENRKIQPIRGRKVPGMVFTKRTKKDKGQNMNDGTKGTEY